MEYSGYSIYNGSVCSDVIREDTEYVYQYMVNKLGFKENHIILLGRSIGTGVALQLAQNTSPGAIALISPFASIKALAKEFAGFLGELFAKETYNNRENIAKIKCPTFLLHGMKDSLISY